MTSSDNNGPLDAAFSNTAVPMDIDKSSLVHVDLDEIFF